MDGSLVFYIVYIDNMFIVVKSMREIDELKSKFGKEFEIKDLGSVRKKLDMKIVGDGAEGRLMSQWEYLKSASASV